jgi:CDP-glycerol glycerophosphotransferase
VSARTERAVIHRCDLVDGVLQLEGDLGGVGDATLVMSRRTGAVSLTYPVFVDTSGDDATFLARVPISDLVSELDLVDIAANTERTAGGVVWDPRLGGRRLTLSVELAEPRFVEHGRQITLSRTAFGNASVVERSVGHVVDTAEWRPGDVLRLAGRFEGEPADDELLLQARGTAEEFSVPIAHDPERGRFTVELTPGRMSTMAGRVPLRQGVYDFLVRRYDGGAPTITSLSLEHRSLSALPQEIEIAGQAFAVGAWNYDDLVLQVGDNRSADESGGFNQRALRGSYQRARASAPLREAVVYYGRHLGPYAGSLRALHEELVRREVPVEHLWVVGEQAWEPPATAQVLVAESADHYEASARSRYLIAEGPWPEWFTRRPDQITVQTGYAAPVKRAGLDLADRPRLTRDLRRWQLQDAANTLYAVSAGPFASDILTRVLPFAEGGQLLEEGVPAHDLALRIDRAAVRARLGVDDDRVVVLYAPTYRDNLRAPGGYWMGPTPDLDRLRTELGADHVLLFRKHWSVLDPVAFDHTGFVCDVTRYPDVGDLLLAADVVVSDYSSLLVQNAAMGRPTVMFTPDLEQFQNHVRGLYGADRLPWPGPVVATTEELIAAIRDLPGLVRTYSSRVAEFAAVFCPLADGKAAARTVDRVFG